MYVQIRKKDNFSWREKIQLNTSCGAAVYVKSSDDCFFGKPVVLHDGNVAEFFRPSDGCSQWNYTFP